MYFIYILKCFDNSFYVGFTSNLVRRMTEHESRHGGTYTKIRTPVELVYQETLESESAARLREKQIKGWSRKKKQALINGDKVGLISLSKSNF